MTEEVSPGARPPASRSWGPPNASAAVGSRRDTVAVADAPTEPDGSLPFSSVGGAVSWWCRPLGERRTWVAAGYLSVGVLWSLSMFVAMVVAMSVTFSLVVVVVGVFLVVPTFALVDAMASLERRRASWVDRTIEPRPLRASGGGVWRSIGSALTDSERWRQAGFVAAFAVVAPLLFALAVLPWQVIVVVVVDVLSDPGGTDLLDAVIALVMLGVAPRLTVVTARGSVGFVAWFLGPDRNAELAERVEELSTQRSEILDAVAAERRRIERNLHDGVQQQLVALGIDIARAQARIDDDPDAARALLDDARTTLRGAIGEMRVIGRGLHPAVLEDRGLDAALSSIISGSPIPITVDVDVPADLPDDTAATAYYVVSEAVANIHKHAHARVASVEVTHRAPGAGPASIRLTVRDDGRGGANLAGGTGLAGMKARVEGVDGTIRIDSPEGGPTTLDVVIPVPPADDRSNVRS
jgi:signal transduction histidine kinase